MILKHLMKGDELCQTCPIVATQGMVNNVILSSNYVIELILSMFEHILTAYLLSLVFNVLVSVNLVIC